METTHRKIELQSPADLTYLIFNASRTARSKIDLHLPPNAAPEGEEDAMRRRVEELVEQVRPSACYRRQSRRKPLRCTNGITDIAQYIQQTFTGVKQNLRINGMEAADMEKHLQEQLQGGEEVEAYDHRLAKRIQDTSAQIEALTLELANLRRSAPKEAARRFQSGFEDEGRVWDEKLRDAEEKRLAEVKKVELDVVGLEREEETRKAWERGMSTLVGVKDGIGGTVARLERAQGVIGYLEGR